MKSWKKILTGIIAAAAAVCIIAGYGLYRMEQNISEKLATDMQDYIQATPETQNQYILTEMDDLLNKIPGTFGMHSALPKAMKKDPQLREAALAWGRSFCATIVKEDPKLYEKLTPEARQKYNQEASELESRGKRFKELIDEASKK